MDPTLYRSIFIWKIIKKIIDETPNINIKSIAEKANISRWTFNQALNWRAIWSDNLFRLAMEAIPLTNTEIKKIFKEADIEELKYKYWEEILSEKEFTYEELLEMVKETENLTAEQVNAVRDFIEFQKNKK